MTAEPLRVCYPSGTTFTVAGEPHHVEIDGGITPVVLDGDGRPVLLDPRAVIFRDDEIIVDPRQQAPERLHGWVRDWLAAHPEWPRVLTETSRR